MKEQRYMARNRPSVLRPQSGPRVKPKRGAIVGKRREKITPPDTHTRGPWRWYGNTKNDDVYLAAPWGGRHLVMSFRRLGMANAQPCFYAGGLRHDIGEFVDYERGYRDDIEQIDHPDARLIAAAPELLDVLKLVESVYRKNVVAVGEPSSVLDAVQAAIAKAEGTRPVAKYAVDPVAGAQVDPSTRDESAPDSGRGSRKGTA